MYKNAEVDAGTELDRYATEFARRAKTDGTAKKRKADVKRFLEWEPPDGERHAELHPFDVEKHFRNLLDDGYAETTVKPAYWNVSSFYDHLVAREVVDANPFESDVLELSNLITVTRNGKKEDELSGFTYLDAEDVDAMCDRVEVAKGSPIRAELVIRTLFQTGVRRGELVNIELSDINREERTIDIHAEKTHANRTVVYGPLLDPLLNIWIDGGERDALMGAAGSPFLFPTDRSEQLSEYAVGEIVRATAEAAGLEPETPNGETGVYTDQSGNPRRKVTPHTLRHSFAVGTLKDGGDCRFLQKLLGHADITTTEKYLKVASDDAVEHGRQNRPR